MTDTKINHSLLFSAYQLFLFEIPLSHVVSTRRKSYSFGKIFRSQSPVFCLKNSKTETAFISRESFSYGEVFSGKMDLLKHSLFCRSSSHRKSV